jgi:hypothetical protein
VRDEDGPKMKRSVGFWEDDVSVSRMMRMGRK